MRVRRLQGRQRHSKIAHDSSRCLPCVCTSSCEALSCPWPGGRWRWPLVLVATTLAGSASAQTPFVPVLRQEQHPLRQLRVAHLHDRPLRDLLLPGDRAAPRARRGLRRERLSADQRRPEARPAVQGAADPVQDAQRVRAAERRSRARRRKASARSPSRSATAWCCRSTSRPTGSTASSSTSSRTCSSSTSSRSRSSAERAAVGERRPVRLRARAVDADRPDDGPRRGGRRHRAEDEPSSRATATRATRASSTTSATRVFEFIEAKWGKEGIRQFLFSLRKSVIGGGEDAYEEAFKMKPDEFDQAFERYLKERFKPFRDKERPADYGRDLAPNPEKTRLRRGAVHRAVAVGRSARGRHGQPEGPELDIVLLSSKDGVDRPQPDEGFDKDMGFDHIVQLGRAVRHDAVDVVVAEGRSPRLLRAHREGAHAHHPERARRGKIEQRIADEVGRRARVADASRPTAGRSRSRRCAAASATSSRVDLETEEVVNLTNDDFADYGADLLARRQVHHLHRARQRQPEAVPLRPRHEEEDAAHLRHARRRPRRSSSTTTRSCSRRRPPIRRVPLEPEVAKNGNIYNIWTLDLNNGELRQYTDALGGNFRRSC